MSCQQDSLTQDLDLAWRRSDNTSCTHRGKNESTRNSQHEPTDQ